MHVPFCIVFYIYALGCSYNTHTHKIVWQLPFHVLESESLHLSAIWQFAIFGNLSYTMFVHTIATITMP